MQTEGGIFIDRLKTGISNDRGIDCVLSVDSEMRYWREEPGQKLFSSSKLIEWDKPQRDLKGVREENEGVKPVVIFTLYILLLCAFLNVVFFTIVPPRGAIDTNKSGSTRDEEV